MSLKLNFYKTALRKKARKGFVGYPAATIIFYGPDDRRATKIAVGIKRDEDADPEMMRWNSSDLDIRRDPSVMEQIVRLIQREHVKSVAPEQILGCPHEEGIDYPSEETCPHCPFWAGRPRPIFSDSDDEQYFRSVTGIPDRRGMEKMTADLDSSRKKDSPLQQAQDIMWDAWDERDRRRRIELAQQALRISEDCADAYVLLAEEKASSLKEAMELYENGIRAGERALGEKAFAEDAGHFWGILETRPYMRARAGLASCLREAGRLDEAISHYQELLCLNPNDNQGNRDDLLVCLIARGRDAEAADLLRQYEEGITANWLYTTALVAFRTSGPTADTLEKLQGAVKHNPHVPGFLLKNPPRQLPTHYQLGSREEAIIYANLFGPIWKMTPGALDWLKSTKVKGSGYGL
jgi:tetratricopeptide (TPR) repeat protein